MSDSTHHKTADAADHHHDDHHVGFVRKYIFSTDHKWIGIQYGITAMLFMLVGFFLMMVMRWSIAYPDQALPEWLTFVFGEDWLNRWIPVGESTGGRVVDGQLYNMFGAMHGTIMVFLAVVPLGFGAFGNYVTPLQIGAPDMAFPKLNMMSYWIYLAGGLLMFASFFLPSGAASTGWTFYPPLGTVQEYHVANQWMTGQTWWLLGMVLLISSSLLGSVNVITTIINLRAKGMTWFRLPFFVWGMLVTAFLLLLAFPPLEVAGLMQLSDRVFGSSFFLPSGLSVNNEVMNISGGGSPLLYQHLFWFLGHPEVYVLLLPAISIVAEIIPNNTRKPLWGYKSMVYGALVLGFLSFIVWAHHMYLTGMGSAISTFFQTTTVLISVPSVILLTSLLISLWGGSIRFTVPMLWACAFLPMFGFGGLTGLPLAFNLTDLYLHDTYYVIGHFHYVVAPGVIFGLFAGIYYWYPKATGRHMNTFLGHLHFWPSLIAINVVFMPMMIQGIAGFHRRWYNGGISYEHTADYLWLNEVISWAVWALAIFQLPFIINFFSSAFVGKKVKSDNPWNATTLEWATPTPPGHGNFEFEPVVYRGPYEYSVPGEDKDYSPQWEEPKSNKK
ncbi:cytochrome c oxidase subunit I [Sulfuriroseicoccus oceanibius]|uniref:Cbb3-type cytochrome c oxidase subunit I n=1 Tax=Sulfuriroseicoccus oceanibius TaxID=2707525 RepID=A0A6B3L4Z3_9BACT|nr:cbb3-type cytochrome c oxidase subunit I [Sulfuriroseicoccus oceanibius]QQL44630.1 cbb3-type cytochrome c oxidase subunit I [Sulfuriroseicoccus oceanibius]